MISYYIILYITLYITLYLILYSITCVSLLLELLQFVLHARGASLRPQRHVFSELRTSLVAGDALREPPQGPQFESFKAV